MMKILLVIIISAFLYACGSSRMVGTISSDQYEKTKIKNIHKSEKATFLYGKYGKKKIRIAATAEEIFEKNRYYDIKLISLKDLTSANILIRPNHRIVRPKSSSGKNNSFAIQTDYKKYKDLYLTKDMAIIVIEEFNQSPFFRTIDIDEILDQF